MIAMNGSIFVQGAQFSLDDVVMSQAWGWGAVFPLPSQLTAHL